MLVNCLSLLLSLSCVALLCTLPSVSVLLLFIPLAGSLFFLRARLGRTLIPLLVFIAGFVYASLVASSYLSQRLPEELLGVEVEIVATIVDLPHRDGRRLRFITELESIRPVNSTALQPRNGRIRLSWYGKDAPDLKAGNKVKLVVKLKPPSGFMNPGGFDLEKWFAQKRIVATGYVRNRSFDVERSVLTRNSASLSSIRNVLQRKLLQASESYSSSGIIVALAVGDRSGITPALWDSFISTGTNHLLAISGLHISLVAGAFALLAQALWRYSGLSAYSTRRASALVIALCAAFCYAAMAGFSVPTVRALMMFAVLVCLLLLRRHQRRTQSLAIALIVVCIVDPLSVLSPGFWMSFAAVAVLFFVFSNVQDDSRMSLIARVLRGHVLISVGLYPLTVFFFGQASLVSPLANLFVTPLVGMLITPLVFFAAMLVFVSIPMASVVLFFVDCLLRVAVTLLEILSTSPYAMVKVAGFSGFALSLAAVSAMLMLLPVTRSVRVLSLVLLLPLVLPVQEEPLQEGDYSVAVLDVGQGTSVVVRTAGHTLVYDTGDQFSEKFSAADAVLLPYLRSKSLSRINALIVSHADRDHSGGADEVLEELQVDTLMLSSKLPQKPDAHYRRCIAGDSWTWDKVTFRILHPQHNTQGSENDRSCVLMITTAGGNRTLLPGDIESTAERQLTSGDRLLPVKVLLSPHHGSATSSGAAFIDATQPEYVVHSAGYRNRFDFPRPEVIDRYRSAGARQFSTSGSGAVEFLVSESGVHFSEYRVAAKRWWHRQ